MFTRQPSMYFQALWRIVCVTICFRLLCSIIVVAEFHEDICVIILSILEWLEDSTIRKNGLDALASLVVYCLYSCLFLLHVLNCIYSRISQRKANTYSFFVGMDNRLWIECFISCSSVSFKDIKVDFLNDVLAIV